jgi:hypothetical protein
MKNRRNLLQLVMAVGASLPLGWAACAQVVTQSLTLQPGWNAIHLEVQPADNSADGVFGALPVASVWARAERLASAEFIQNASEAAFNEAGWLRWFHPSRPEAFLNNLHAVHANRSYLVKSTNANPINWSVTGRPALRQTGWVPDAYNLRGLPVDPVTPPTFLNFFRHSAAHFNAASSQLEKIYRLNSSGQWTQVSSNEFAQAGAAYWIYTRGASDFVAPLSAALELGDGLDFGLELSEVSLRLRNGTASSMNVMVQDLGLAGPVALSYYQFNPALGGQWPPLPTPLVSSPAAGAEVRLRIGVRRQDLAGASYASVLEIKNGAGTRFLLPVSAEKGAVAAGIHTRAGLWVGTATLNAVSEANSANPTNPTPTKSELNLRLLIHVNAAGQARLLKQVIQMWRDGTFVTGPNGDRVPDQPGEFVLLTDDSLIPLFNGATVRDGEPVGRRISTVGYDFPVGATDHFLNLAGGLDPGQKLTGTLTVPFDHATNPFKHRYHPDHDNLNARFDGPATESFTATRQLELEFTASPPGPAAPDFGYNVLGGVYRERITGVHNRPIRVSGTFRLSRISPIAELNPGPTP